MRRLAWTFADCIGDKYQIRLTRSKFYTLWLTDTIEVGRLSTRIIPKISINFCSKFVTCYYNNQSMHIFLSIGHPSMVYK